MVRVAYLVSVSRETFLSSAQALAVGQGVRPLGRTPDFSLLRPARQGLRKRYAALRALDRPPATPLPNTPQAPDSLYSRSKYLLLSCLKVAPARLIPCTVLTSTVPPTVVPPRITREKPMASSAAKKSADALWIMVPILA